MISHHKKGEVDLTKMLMQLIFVGLLIVLAMSIGCSIFGASRSAEAYNSFDEFSKLLTKQNNARDGERESYPLIMDKETAVLYFPEGKDVFVQFEWTHSLTFKQEGDITNYRAIFHKPESCGDKACLYLCRDYEETSDIMMEQMIVKNFKCKDNPNYVRQYPFPIDGKCDIKDSGTNIYKCDWGLIMANGLKEMAISNLRTRIVWMEKGTIGDKSAVGFCQVPPCLKSNEEKAAPETKKTETSKVIPKATTTKSLLAVGDSITERGGYLNDIATRCPKLTFKRAGYSGKGVTTIKSNAASFFKSNYDFVVVMAGVNNLPSVGNQEGIDKVKNDLEALYKDARANNPNRIIIAITILPWGKYGTSTAYAKQATLEINKWITSKPANVDLVIDAYPVMESPAGSGNMNTSYTGDGLHPEAAGYKVLNDLVYKALSQYGYCT